MTWRGIAACLAFALAAAVPFQPWSASRGASSFEVEVTSDEAGLATLYYDVGGGFIGQDSAVQAIPAGRAATLRFALPSGRLRALNLAPMGRDFRMALGDARIVDDSGVALERFGPERLRPAYQIDSREVRNGKAFISSPRGSTQAQLVIDLATPLELPRANGWIGVAAVFAGLLALAWLVEAAGRSRRVRLYDRARSCWASAQAAPVRALLATAFVATLAANYPVVFLGKSLVSPNMGIALLYGTNPWVPGFQSVERGDANSADINALMWQHVPYSMIQRRALFSDGELPLWNRYNSAGTPLLGQGQSSFGDPLHMIPVLADGAAWAWDLQLLLSKGLLALGIGCCVWLLTRSLAASLLMTASAQFIGFFVYRVCHPAVFGFCYAPWILFFWMRMAGSRSTRGAMLWSAALLGANLAEFASGTVKEAYMLLLCMNFSGACLMMSWSRALADRLRLLGIAAAQGVVFLMVSAPGWTTFLGALKRAYTSYDAAQAYQVQPAMLVGLFDELFYRPFQLFQNVIDPSANFFVLLGLLWAVVRWRTLLADRRALALAGSAVPALLLVFGVIPASFIARVPFLANLMHVDNTFSCVLVILFLVLAGIGWRQALESLGSPRGGRDAASVILLLVALYAAYVGNAQATVRTTFAPDTWGALVKLGTFTHAYGLSLILGSALLLWAIHRGRAAGWTVALAIAAALGFAALHWRGGLQEGMAFPRYVIMPTARVDLAADSPSIDSLAATGGQPFRSVGFVDSLLPGWTAAYGVEGICGPDALMNRYYRQLMDASGMERVWDWRLKLEDPDLKAVRPVLDLLGVRWYLDFPAGLRRSTQELKPFSSLDMEAYESPTAWPRAFFTDRLATYAKASELVSWARAAKGTPFAAVQPSEPGAADVPRALPADLDSRHVAAASDYKLTANTTSFTVSASGPGVIVLSEAFEAGNFRATLNGLRVPYFRANHAFKGIFVDRPGTYRVSFSYWPAGLGWALAASAVGLGLEALWILGSLALPSGAQTPEKSLRRP